jgi:hypothetical protein
VDGLNAVSEVLGEEGNEACMGEERTSGWTSIEVVRDIVCGRTEVRAGRPSVAD